MSLGVDNSSNRLQPPDQIGRDLSPTPSSISPARSQHDPSSGYPSSQDESYDSAGSADSADPVYRFVRSDVAAEDLDDLRHELSTSLLPFEEPPAPQTDTSAVGTVSSRATLLSDLQDLHKDSEGRDPARAAIIDEYMSYIRNLAPTDNLLGGHRASLTRQMQFQDDIYDLGRFESEEWRKVLHGIPKTSSEFQAWLNAP